MTYDELKPRLLLGPGGGPLLFDPNGHSGAFLWLMGQHFPGLKIEAVVVTEGGSRGVYAAFQPGHVVELVEFVRGTIWGLFIHSMKMKLGHWRTDQTILPITVSEPKTMKLFADKGRAEMTATVVREVFGYQAVVRHYGNRGWGVDVVKSAAGAAAIDRSEITRLEGICMLLSKYAITPAPCEILDVGTVLERHEPSAPHRPGRQVVRSRAAG